MPTANDLFLRSVTDLVNCAQSPMDRAELLELFIGALYDRSQLVRRPLGAERDTLLRFGTAAEEYRNWLAAEMRRDRVSPPPSRPAHLAEDDLRPTG